MLSFGVKTGTLSKPRNQGDEPIAITKENLRDEKLDHKHQENNS